MLNIACDRKPKHAGLSSQPTLSRFENGMSGAAAAPTRSIEAMGHELPLRPLRDEVAGKHDLVRPSISLDSMSSAVVSKHESMHDELLMHTSFGGIQHNLALMREISGSDGKYTELFDAWITHTLEASREAHESYATYLSIKSFNQADEPSLLDLHPLEYRGYFDTLSSRLDHHLGSSFLQYLVAKAVVTAAFSGTLASRLVTEEALSKPRVYPQESPDLRLEAILAGYEKHLWKLLQDTVDRCLKQQINEGALVAGFSPYSEASWKGLNSQASIRLERALMGVLHPLMLSVTRDVIGLPTYDYDNTERDLGALVEACTSMLRRGGADIEVTHGKEGRPDEDKLKQHRLGEVHVQNGAKIPDEEVRPFEGSVGQNLRPNNVAITRRLHTSVDEISWRLCVLAERAVSEVYDLDDEQVRRALNLDRPWKISQGQTSFLETVVVGVRSFRDFVPLFDRYDDCFSHSEHIALFDTVFWYMGGNFVEWFDTLTSLEGARVYVLVLVTPDVDPTVYAKRPEDGRLEVPTGMLNSTSIPPRLIMVRVPDGVGYFVRLVPGYEAQKLLLEILPKKIGRFPERERNYLKHVSEKILLSLFATWERI